MNFMLFFLLWWTYEVSHAVYKSAREPYDPYLDGED